VTRNVPAMANGNTPILESISKGLSIVVASFNISTLASAETLTALSLGVILFKNINTTKAIPVNTPEHAKNTPEAICVEGAAVTESIDAIGGNIPDKPWPVMIAWVYSGPYRPARPNAAYWIRAVADEPMMTEKIVKT
jgi:hypothetical protein